MSMVSVLLLVVVLVTLWSLCLWCSGDVFSFWFVFFFKKKTAYQMRISDWSSDVCSSDLLKLGLPVVPLIRSTIFEHFCGGETIEDCEDNIAHLWEYGVGTILDYSVEGEKTEAAFDATEDEIISTIGRARKDNKVTFTVFTITDLGHFEMLEQLAYPDADVVASGAGLSPDDKAEFEILRARVDRIFGESFRYGIPVLIDAEESWIQDTIDSLALEMMEKYNREKAIVYNTYQLYRTDRLERLKAHTEKAASQGFCLGVKLVRGAYMEKERDRAEELNKPSPIHPNKAGSDRDFDAAAGWCLDHIDQLAFIDRKSTRLNSSH